MQTSTHKIVYYKDDDFELAYEIFSSSSICIHANVFKKFTPRIARKGYVIFAKMQHWFTESGFSYLFTVNDNPEFSEMYGAISIKQLNYKDKEYEVLIWDLKQPQL